MSEIEWQLFVNGGAVKGGAALLIRDRWQSDGTVYCRIAIAPTPTAAKSEASFGDLFSATTTDGRLASTDTEEFIVYANVSVGGKNYLLLKNLDVSQPRTFVIRMDTGKAFAMD